MRRRRLGGFTLIELSVYLAGLATVGAAALAVTLAADRDRRTATGLAADVESLRRAADALARDVRSAPSPRWDAETLVAGGATWRLDGDELLRTDAAGEQRVARRVAGFVACVDPDGTTHARIELAARDPSAARRPGLNVVARPRVTGRAR